MQISPINNNNTSFGKLYLDSRAEQIITGGKKSIQKRVNKIAKELEGTKHWDLHVKTSEYSDNSVLISFKNKQFPDFEYKYGLFPTKRIKKAVEFYSYIEKDSSEKLVSDFLVYPKKSEAKKVFNRLCKHFSKSKCPTDDFFWASDAIKYLDRAFSLRSK